MKYEKPTVEIVDIENEDIVTISDNCVNQTGQNCVSLNGYCSAYGGQSRNCTSGVAMVGGQNLIIGACDLLTTTGTWRCTEVVGTAPGCGLGNSMTCVRLSGSTCNSIVGATS